MADQRNDRTHSAQSTKRALSDAEVQALIDAVAPAHRLLFVLLAETGLRRSEAAGLTWADLDSATMELSVSAQLHRSLPVRIAPKTANSHRTIALSPQLTARLREHYLASGRPEGGAYIFRRLSGEPYYGTAIGDIATSAAKRAGLDGITAHHLRHTHASKLIANGWDPIEVAARVGDTVTTVERTYAHQWEQARRRRDQSERLAKLYGEAGNSGLTAARSQTRLSATAGIS